MHVTKGELGMSIVHEHHRLPGLFSDGARAVWEGVAALLTLVAMVATLCGMATWAAVELVRALV